MPDTNISAALADYHADLNAAEQATNAVMARAEVGAPEGSFNAGRASVIIGILLGAIASHGGDGAESFIAAVEEKALETLAECRRIKASAA